MVTQLRITNSLNSVTPSAYTDYASVGALPATATNGTLARVANRFFFAYSTTVGHWIPAEAFTDNLAYAANAGADQIKITTASTVADGGGGDLTDLGWVDAGTTPPVDDVNGIEFNGTNVRLDFSFTTFPTKWFALIRANLVAGTTNIYPSGRMFIRDGANSLVLAFYTDNTLNKVSISTGPATTDPDQQNTLAAYDADDFLYILGDTSGLIRIWNSKDLTTEIAIQASNLTATANTEIIIGTHNTNPGEFYIKDFHLLDISS